MRHSEGDSREAYRAAALQALERSVEEGYSDPFRVSAEQDLDPLHEDERFKRVVDDLTKKAAENKK